MVRKVNWRNIAISLIDHTGSLTLVTTVALADSVESGTCLKCLRQKSAAMTTGGGQSVLWTTTWGFTVNGATGVATWGNTMRTMAVAITIVLAAVVSPKMHAKPDSGYTTVVLEYIGKTNRPISPIIISSSAEEAQWYRRKLFSDPISMESINITEAPTWLSGVAVPVAETTTC